MPRVKKILNYQDLQKIAGGDNKEPLVVLNKLYPDIICHYQKKDMRPYVGFNILVRKSLGVKLNRANQKLQKLLPEAKLKIVYGYRHPAIQQKYFKQFKKKLAEKYPRLNDFALTSLTHNFVASPDVAGHSVGGAVDITIVSQGRELDMGTKIADYHDSEKIKTFSKKISRKQIANRTLLHNLLVAQGLAPFYGEWWHFSYGDKEWAKFYNKKKSLYSEIVYKNKS